jgi:hypothetical protein
MTTQHNRIPTQTLESSKDTCQHDAALGLALQDIEIAFEVMVFRLVCQLAQETERDTPRVLEL